MPSRSAITRPPLRAGAMQPGSVGSGQRSTFASGDPISPRVRSTARPGMSSQ